MDKEQALSIIEQALNIAAKSGAFDLAVSTQVYSAIQRLKQAEPSVVSEPKLTKTK